jgi:putative acetyltransferase
MCWFRQSIENIEHSIVVAELGNNAVIVGFGCVIPSKQEIRTIYVDSVFARQGVGSKILAYLEELALRHGTDKLYLDASLNAEKFYSRHGYSVIERATRRLNSGISMGCVKISKYLQTH